MLIGCYIVLATAALFLTIFPPENKRVSWTLLVLMAIVMIVPAWRLEGIDRGVYLLGYEDWNCIAETSYHNISDFVAWHFGDVRFVLLFYAVLAVAIKLTCFARFMPQAVLFGAVLVYLSHFYMLHEMVQIRCGLASAFFIAALCLRMRRTASAWTSLVIPAALIAVASWFHYSAVIGFVVLLVPLSGFSALVWGGLLVGAIVLSASGMTVTHILSMLPFGFAQAGLDKYLDKMDKGLDLAFNPFGVTMLVRYIVYACMIRLVHRSAHVYRPITYLLKLYGIGLLIALLFADMPAMAVRAGQFLFVVEIILVPLLSYRQMKDRAWIPIVAFSVVNAAINVFLIHLFATEAV